MSDFFRLEASGGILLFFAAILALILCNTGFASLYQQLFHLNFSIQLGEFALSKPLLLWINDGLMAIFFLLVGLEIKAELYEGALSSLPQITLPAMAAVGGMVVPALIYFFFNHHDPQALRGWAIPTATDIAFSLGILSLLGSRVPVSLKIFLTALAIFDDIGAILIIAIFYTQHVAAGLLLMAAAVIVLLVILNRLRVCARAPYVMLGIVLWVCVLKSGVHATLAGIVLAFCIPLKHKQPAQPSPLRQMEHALHPWVAFAILPVFAFANSGIILHDMTMSHVFHSIPLGIAAGLFVGKQLGVWLASYLGVKAGLAALPERTNFWHIYGVSLLAGVGFTMSLFIGTLAFGVQFGEEAALVRFGVIAGSMLSGLLGYWVLRCGLRRSTVLD